MAQRKLTLQFAEADWLHSYDFGRLTASQRLGIEHLAACDDFAVLGTATDVDGVRTMRLVPGAALVAIVPDLARFAAPVITGTAA